MEERKQIKFTVVPDDSSNTVSESTTTELKERKVRTYANFCGISHTPFDFTLTFCEMEPPTEKLASEAGPDQELKAPVKARLRGKGEGKRQSPPRHAGSLPSA